MPYTAAASEPQPEGIINIAVLVSGSGTNLQALIDSPEIRGHICLVLSDRPDAPALDRARAAGILTAVVDWNEYPSRVDFSDAVANAVEEAGAEMMVLAGFMRILDVGAIDRFRDRIINVHPSLLPAFPGAHAVRRALAEGAKITGVTVHFVDEGVDTGPIIAQRAVTVHEDDNEASLHERIQAEEHRLLPDVVGQLLDGRVRVDSR